MIIIIYSSVVVQSFEYINLQQLNLQVLIQEAVNRCLAEALTWTLWVLLGSLVKLVQPAWQGEIYSTPSEPHTGLKALDGQEQLE